MTVSLVGRMAMGSDRSDSPDLVTHATCVKFFFFFYVGQLFLRSSMTFKRFTSGAKSSMWVFSLSRAAEDTNMGK